VRTCSDCRHFRPVTVEVNYSSYSHGSCRHSPPQVAPLTPTPIYGGPVVQSLKVLDYNSYQPWVPEGVPVSSFPLVAYGQEGCGQWSPVLPESEDATGKALAEAVLGGDSVAREALLDHLLELRSRS